MTVRSASISVEVAGLTTVTLESDAGTLNPKRAFLPFGPQANAGARFMISCPEALSKVLSSLALSIRWQGLPNLTTQYAGHRSPAITPAYFTVSGTFQDGLGSEHPFSGEHLFTAGSSDTSISLTAGGAAPAPKTSDAQLVYALATAGSSRALQKGGGLAKVRPSSRPF